MTICVECRHRRNPSGPVADYPTEDDHCYAPKLVSFVTGRPMIGFCKEVNHGNCPHFEAKEGM